MTWRLFVSDLKAIIAIGTGGIADYAVQHIVSEAPKRNRPDGETAGQAGEEAAAQAFRREIDGSECGPDGVRSAAAGRGIRLFRLGLVGGNGPAELGKSLYS